jgi:hypothetical protein
MPETGGRGRRDLGREVGRRAFGSKELEGPLGERYPLWFLLLEPEEVAAAHTRLVTEARGARDRESFTYMPLKKDGGYVYATKMFSDTCVP